MNPTAVQSVIQQLRQIFDPAAQSGDYSEFEFKHAAANLWCAEQALFGSGVDCSQDTMGGRINSLIQEVEKRLTSQLKDSATFDPKKHYDVDQLSELIKDAQSTLQESDKLASLLSALANWINLPTKRAVHKEVSGLVHTATDRCGTNCDFNFDKGTLREQASNQNNGSDKQSVINDVQIAVHQTFDSIKERPHITDALCEYLLSATTIENERFFARELLLHFRNGHESDPDRVEFIDRCVTVAKSLVRLESFVPVMDVRAIENELDLPTRDPRCWLAVLDNLVNGNIIEENTGLVVRTLRFSRAFSGLYMNPAVSKKVADLIFGEGRSLTVSRHLEGPWSADLFLGPFSDPPNY